MLRVGRSMRVSTRVDVTGVGYLVRMSAAVADTVRRRDHVCMPGANAVHLVAARVVPVMASAMAARETEECHGGHAGGSENHAEDVKVHLY
jgi:hypothetical protein